MSETCGDSMNNFCVKDAAMLNVCCKVLRSTANAKVTRFCRNISVQFITESSNS